MRARYARGDDADALRDRVHERRSMPRGCRLRNGPGSAGKHLHGAGLSERREAQRGAQARPVGRNALACSGRIWAVVPAALGQSFRRHLGTDSGALGQSFRRTWAPVPEDLGGVTA